MVHTNSGGDSAIGRIPVVSASGKPLMPCRVAKALSLLGSGRAYVEWDSDGAFRLHLRFDPKSPIMRLMESEEEAYEKPLKRPAGIWKVAPPTRKFIGGLWEIVQADPSRMECLTDDEKAYMEALLQSEWTEIKSQRVLNVLTPIVKKMLGAFGEASQPKPLSLSMLLRARSVGKRNGKYSLLRKTEPAGIALLESAISYMKGGYVILASKVRDAIESIVEKLLPPLSILPKTRILKRGLERAESLLKRLSSAGVMKWAPQALNWLNNKAYRMWLGITYAL